MGRLFSLAIVVCLTLSPAAAARWNVDHANSRLGFTVRWSDEPFVATFQSWNAAISFDPSNIANAKVVVSIDLGSEASDSPDNDDGIKGPEGFAISQFPAARFETTSFTAKGGNSYVAEGRLTIHGTSRPIALPFTLMITGNKAHVTGRVVVLRTDFGLGKGEWASASTIAHEVAITIDLTATKAR
jgi:polyisoprenoid-binding protein YceI